MTSKSSTIPQSEKEEYLTSPALVSEYLSASPSVPSRFRNPTSVSQLSGGTGNFVFRLHLASGESAVLKHSAPFIATWREMPFDISRWDVERKSLYTPDGLLKDIKTEHVKIPELYYADAEKKVLIIEDAGETATNLKALLSRGGELNGNAMKTLGNELGLFLAKLHSTTSSNGKIRKEFKDVFESDPARKMCAWRTFGRIKDSLAKWVPPYEYSTTGGTEEELDKLSEKLQKDIMTNNECVTMGDFWTGNVLVCLSPSGELEAAYIVDWELVHPGDPSTDVAQMTAEAFCSYSFGNKVAAETLVKAFHQGYIEHAQIEEGKGFKEKVMIYAGGHVATWVPWTGWTDDKARATKVAVKGIDMLWEGLGVGKGDTKSDFCDKLV